MEETVKREMEREREEGLNKCERGGRERERERYSEDAESMAKQSGVSKSLHMSCISQVSAPTPHSLRARARARARA